MGAHEQMTKELSGDQPDAVATTSRRHMIAGTAELPACATDDKAECPQCACTMLLWAGFYRCSNCGYKESCCF